jgi:hypothetical protein
MCYEKEPQICNDIGQILLVMVSISILKFVTMSCSKIYLANLFNLMYY